MREPSQGTSGAQRPPARDPEAGKVALVLSGGGIPGWMYEIGCLTALDEFFQDGFSTNTFDIYVGTSAGANAAALLANGVPPREIYDAIVAESPSPYNFGRKDIYAFGTGETWPMLRKVAASLWRLFRNLMGGLFRRGERASLLDMLYMIQESLPSGLFTLDPLESHLREMLSSTPGMSDDFRDLGPELYIPAVDLDRGWYTNFGMPGHDDVPISRAVVASSAVPILFQPVRIKDADYVDGGIGRVANMDVAVDQGAKMLLVINPVVHLDNDRKRICMPTCYGFCRGLKDKGMSFVADQAMRVNTSMRLRIAKAQQERMHPGLDVAIIEPSPQDALMFTQNVVGHDARQEVVRYGYRSTVAYLTEHFEDLEKRFAAHGIRVSLDRFRGRQQIQGFRVLGPNERHRVNGAKPVPNTG